MKVIKTGVESVDDLYDIEFTGNMIPHSWYAAIQTENSRPDLAAIVILAEILYWHRPTVERTADDAAVIVLKKKFHADLLQMSYAQIEKKLFLSKAQSRRALEKLENLGLIERCLRTVVTESGNKLGNVMYIKLFTQRLLEITFPGYDPCKKYPTRVSAETDKVIGENRQACLSEPMTNTEITTEITDTDYTSFYQQERAKVRDQVEYEYLIMDRKNDKGCTEGNVAQDQGEHAALEFDGHEQKHQADGCDDIRIQHRQIVDFQNCGTDDPFGLGKADSGNRTDNGGNHRGDHRDDQGDGDGFQHGPVAEHVFIPTQGESGEIGLGFPFVEGKQHQVNDGQINKQEHQDQVERGEKPGDRLFPFLYGFA